LFVLAEDRGLEPRWA